jgi:hypothetical protein
MTSRREFLQIGVAASALPWAAYAGAVVRSVPVDAVPLYKVVYDRRFSAGVEFAQRASALGHSVHAINGDMTRFWYDDLYHRWRRGAAAIAGLTGRGALFCLEQLAWDQRMRVVFRAEHFVGDDGCVAHRFEGTPALLASAADAVSEPGWAAAMADIVGQCAPMRAGRMTASAVTTRASTTPAGEPLFSWVIAPVIRG